MRLRIVLTLQELSSAACCSGNHWQGSALADSTGLGVLFLDIEKLSFLLRVEQISWGPTGLITGRAQTFSRGFLASIL